MPGVSAIIVALNPEPSDFRKALQVGARDLLQVPVERKELLDALKKAAEASQRKRTTLEGMAAQLVAQKEVKVAKRIVVFSTKGGTGKTFVATNLAAGLAASGKRVAIVDLDLQLGDAAIALGLVPQRTIYDLVQGYREFDIGVARRVHGQAFLGAQRPARPALPRRGGEDHGQGHPGGARRHPDRI